jgi:predicted nucleic acid-binding protein
MLDSDVLIAAERQRIAMPSVLARFGDQRIAMASVTAAELLVGCERARDESTRFRRRAFVEALLDAVPVLPFGVTEARQYAALHAMLLARGEAIGSHDTMIAATAIANGCTLVTMNVREFGRVPGLQLLTVLA